MLIARGSGTGTVSWTSITGKPTTVTGYGITDAYKTGEALSLYQSSTSLTGKPNGTLYYDSIGNQFKAYRNSLWKDIIMNGDIVGSNGITTTGNSLKLGGNLTQATTISGSGFDFSVHANNTNSNEQTRLKANSSGFFIDQTSGEYGTASGYLFGVTASGFNGSTNSAAQFNLTTKPDVGGRYAGSFGATMKTSAATSSNYTNYAGYFSVNMTGDATHPSNIRNGIAGYFRAINSITGTNQNNYAYAIYADGGFVRLNGLPTYADDTAAGVGALPEGCLYKTSTGDLRIKLPYS